MNLTDGNKHQMVKYDPPEVYYWGPEIDRETALALGHVRYFTGAQCKWGHIAERLTNSWGCVECLRQRKLNDTWKAVRNPHDRQRYRNDPDYRETTLEKNKGWRRNQAAG